MSVLDWLFSDVALARKEALARINALSQRSHLIDEQYARMSQVARAVAPLLQAEEMAGNRPARVILPQAEADVIDDVFRKLFELGQNNAFGRVGDGMTLFGVRVERGDQLSVVCGK
jgi:hypothetical protein